MTTNARIRIPDGFWNALKQLGVKAPNLVRKAGLPLRVINESFVTIEHYYALWQAYSDIINDIEFGMVQLPTVFETAQYPPAVLAAYHARDYRDALKRMARYKEMCPPETLHIIEEHSNCTIELESFDKGLIEPALLVGTTITFLLELGRRGTGYPIKAKRVEFTHSFAQVNVLKEYFGCPIQIGAKRNRLTLHMEDLDRPFSSYNAELLEVLTPVLEQTLEEQRSNQSITGVVKWLLTRNLTGDKLDIHHISFELGMSERTLQRRLVDEHTNYKEVLKNVRHEQARLYLANPKLEIREVAFLVGYKDQSSFYRAFRDWEGETPLKWRARHLK
ncbi:helix-turn-helix transcriptional regulator [Shouchella lehensis]|uniref:HTH-type transcription regulator domain-containing protein n=1 Tax=Shouchella lehensis G1 TaxID=1246626 RepID=A0A060M149_9BACI|nr:AraC family transcriptional regulator [Shouchella lehensis]AIC95755.1 HTH-type transcription regulator domain-containing protein [Shouchella lehensis G1]